MIHDKLNLTQDCNKAYSLFQFGKQGDNQSAGKLKPLNFSPNRIIAK
jgi:hypothetical protein